MTITEQEFNSIYHHAICLYSKTEVEKAFDQIAEKINKQLAHTNPILLCVLIGGLVTLGNLLPRLDFPLEVDYVHVSRYAKSQIGQQLTWKAIPSLDLQGRTVIIVDDILDAGITMQHVVNFCQRAQAKEVYTAVLVDKKNARVADGLQQADFCGLEVDNYYVFGYGLDYQGYLRNAPGIFKLADKVKDGALL